MDVQGVSATISDLLDRRGFQLAVPSRTLSLRTSHGRSIVGKSVTLRYLPERRNLGEALDAGSQLAYRDAYAAAEPSNVIVVESPAGVWASTMGAIAAATAIDEGIAGCITDGGIRDVEQISGLGFPVWSRYVTPVTGKGRLEGAQINSPICCGGVQVHPGDVVVADETGICFIPEEISADVISAALEVSRRESREIQRRAADHC